MLQQPGDWRTQHRWEYEALELRDLVRQHCLLRGHFVLSSGRVSDHYLDCRQLLRADCMRIAARLVLLKLRRERLEVDALAAGETLAAALLGAVLGEAALQGRYQWRAAVVRKGPKEHGPPQEVGGEVGEVGGDVGSRVVGTLRPGDRVVLLDDVATSGQTLLDGVAQLANMGCKVLATVVLVDRQEGACQALQQAYGAEVLFLPLLTRKDLLGESGEGAPGEVWG